MKAINQERGPRQSAEIMGAGGGLDSVPSITAMCHNTRRNHDVVITTKTFFDVIVTLLLLS